MLLGDQRPRCQYAVSLNICAIANYARFSSADGPSGLAKRVDDASPTLAALLAQQRWVERLVEKEVKRLTRRRKHYQAMGRAVPRWVRHGMGECFARVQQVKHRVRMLLGVLAAKGVLPLEFKPAYGVGDLLLHHVEDLLYHQRRDGHTSHGSPHLSLSRPHYFTSSASYATFAQHTPL